MNPNIADLGKERPSVLHDDQGGMYPVILSTRQIDIDPNERYLYDCPNCYAHIDPDSWLFYVERPFVDGSRDASEVADKDGAGFVRNRACENCS